VWLPGLANTGNTKILSQLEMSGTSGIFKPGFFFSTIGYLVGK
jgi:hypothetical protein